MKQLDTNKMNTDTPTQPAMLAAFQAGLQSADATEIFRGMIVHHKDFTLTDKTALALAEAKRCEQFPENPAGHMTLHTMLSFAAVVMDHRDNRTALFGDTESGTITAIFDFLQTGGYRETNPDTRERGWGQFTASINFRESRKLLEWKKTLAWMDQAEFSNFIEDHLEDIVTPTGQDLLALVTDMEASSSGSFKGRVNLDNGNVALHYQDDVETTVEVPRNLMLGIPLFEHGDRYRLSARLRFLIRGGKVVFRLLFTNLEDAKEQEFERIVQELEEKTGRPIYRGNLKLPW